MTILHLPFLFLENLTSKHVLSQLTLRSIIYLYGVNTLTFLEVSVDYTELLKPLLFEKLHLYSLLCYF